MTLQHNSVSERAMKIKESGVPPPARCGIGNGSRDSNERPFDPTPSIRQSAEETKRKRGLSGIEFEGYDTEQSIFHSVGRSLINRVCLCSR